MVEKTQNQARINELKKRMGSFMYAVLRQLGQARGEVKDGTDKLFITTIHQVIAKLRESVLYKQKLRALSADVAELSELCTVKQLAYIQKPFFYGFTVPEITDEKTDQFYAIYEIPASKSGAKLLFPADAFGDEQLMFDALRFRQWFEKQIKAILSVLTHYGAKEDEPLPRDVEEQVEGIANIMRETDVEQLVISEIDEDEVTEPKTRNKRGSRSIRQR